MPCFDTKLFVGLSIYLEMRRSFLSYLFDECDIFNLSIHGVDVSEVFHFFGSVIIEGHWTGGSELLYRHIVLFWSVLYIGVPEFVNLNPFIFFDRF